MNLEKTLDRLHSQTVKHRLLQLFTSFVRILLAFAFIPPSIPKITHQRFTLLPTSDPVGHYFEALYQTGFYYDFIGWSQLTAVLLLLIPRTSHIGALMFFPIIVNIAVLTTSVGFRGTWLITILMSIACFYLVCWDYPRWKSIFFSERGERTGFTRLQLAGIPFLIAACGLAMFLFLSFLIGNAIAFQLRSAAIIFGLGLVFGLAITTHLYFMYVKTAGQEGVSAS